MGNMLQLIVENRKQYRGNVADLRLDMTRIQACEVGWRRGVLGGHVAMISTIAGVTPSLRSAGISAFVGSRERIHAGQRCESFQLHTPLTRRRRQTRKS